MDGAVLLNQPDQAKPRLSSFKFVVQAVMLATDPVTGATAGEVAAEPTVLYGAKALVEWAQGFDQALETMQTENEEEQADAQD